MTDKAIITPSQITLSLNRYVSVDMDNVQKLSYNVVFTYPEVKKTFLCLVKT